MTDRLYDELYPRLNLLNRIRESFNEFYKSWWHEKCLNYTGKRLSDYYDIFFSRFVVFNSLYNTIIYTKESIELLAIRYDKKLKVIERGDKEKATTIMSEELSVSELNLLFKKPNVSTSIKELVDILESKKFVITHKAGQQVPADDLLILARLKNNNLRDRFLGVLELVYRVRCNLFHGSKGYEHDQIILLKPINEILHETVSSLYNSFTTLLDGSIREINNEIEELEKK